MFVGMNKFTYLYQRKPKAGNGVGRSPLVSEYYFEFHSDFPNAKRNEESHRALGFHFLPTLFKVFGFPCFMLQRYTCISGGCKFY